MKTRSAIVSSIAPVLAPALAMSLVLALVLALAAGPAQAQEFDRKPDNPANTVEEESEVMDRDIDESKWVFPDSGWQKSRRPDQVFQAFPQDDAYFTLGSVVTLGWQPVLEPTLDISYYEVVIKSSVLRRAIIARTGLADENTTTTYLFRPKEPGRYFWTVRAVTGDGMIIPAVGRYLNVVN